MCACDAGFTCRACRDTSRDPRYLMDRDSSEDRDDRERAEHLAFDSALDASLYPGARP